MLIEALLIFSVILMTDKKESARKPSISPPPRKNYKHKKKSVGGASRGRIVRQEKRTPAHKKIDWVALRYWAEREFGVHGRG